jgi:dual specificity phosphatase 3
LPNISQVTEQLWTGGDRGRTSMATYLAQLEAAGITHVIDCRPHGQPDQAYAQAHVPHIGYLFNPQYDNGQKMPDWWFVDGVDFALHAMRDPAAKVLAHCELGINRGPSMALAVLLAIGMTPEMARAAITAARPIARIAYADDAAKWWAELTAPEVFYHGGKSGLNVGDFLLPPTVTGVTTYMDKAFDALPDVSAAFSDAYMEDWRQSYHETEDHRVFVTADLSLAVWFALQHPRGNVYQVEPLGKLVDITGLPASQITCDRARIVAVVMECPTQAQFALAAQEDLARRKATS